MFGGYVILLIPSLSLKDMFVVLLHPGLSPKEMIMPWMASTYTYVVIFFYDYLHMCIKDMMSSLGC